MKVINIDDFSGGISTLPQMLIQNNQCASASINVWAPRGPLTKMGGLETTFLSLTATGDFLDSLYIDAFTSTAYAVYIRIQTAGSSVSGAHFAWGILGGGTPSPLGYTTGTVSISGGTLISATGNGTLWSSHVSAGDYFRVDATSTGWHSISSVEDNTHLTLGTAVLTAIATGSAYTAMQALDDSVIPWATLNGSWYSSTRVNLMQRFDGAGITRIPIAPKAAYLVTHKNYMFAARTTTAESRLYWSAIKDPTAWPANNFIDVDKDFGRIMGIFSYGNELIVFKSRTMYRIVGEIFDPANPSYAAYPIPTPSGFIFSSISSAAVWDGILTFHANDNFYQYSGGGNAIRLVSLPFSRFAPTDVNSWQNQRVDTKNFALAFRNYYIVRGVGITGPGAFLALIFDKQGASFGTPGSIVCWAAGNTLATAAGGTSDYFGYAPMFVETSAQFNNALNPSTVYMSSINTPKITAWDIVGPNTSLANNYQTSYRDITNDTAIGIAATWLSKEFNIGYGSFKRLVVFLKKQSAGTMSVDWAIDQKPFVTNSIDMTTGRGNVIRKVLDINENGSTIQIRVQQNTAGQTFEIYGFQIHYEPDEMNRLV